MISVSLPHSREDSADALGVDTLGRLVSYLLSWRQGAGAFGGLHLHECWNDNSVLSRGYHGLTASFLGRSLKEFVKMEKQTGDAFYRIIADGLAREILWLQMPDGGLVHASNEYEPTYTREESCPIHQALPSVGLMAYYEMLSPEDPVRGWIATFMKRQLAWMDAYWWKRGNAWSGPLEFAGWCGVTNQDLEVVLALALYGKVFGIWEPFETRGLAALETYLGPRYFYENTGLFERGDRADFTERSTYMVIIHDALRQIGEIARHPRIPALLDRISELLALAMFTDAHGGCRVAWGADDAATARDGRLVWDASRATVEIGYSRVMRRTDTAAAAVIEQEMARYVSVDGTLAAMPNRTSPLFSVTPSSSQVTAFLEFLLDRHPQGVRSEHLPPVPCVRREWAGLSFTSSENVWVLREHGEVRFRGVKRVSHGVLGPGQELPNYHFHEPEPEFCEIITAHENA